MERISSSRMPRHITLSSMQGMVTELEKIGAAFGPEGHYVIRHHRASDANQAILEVSASDATSWTGFHYQPGQWSFVKNGKVCC